MTDGLVPGEVRPAEGTVAINEDRETTEVAVANAGDRPVQVGSHFHFFEANAALRFDREAAFGTRLNVPAGTAVRFEPGDEKTIELVAVGGDRRVHGLNGLVNGSVDGDPAAALERARERGYLSAGEEAAATGREEPTGEEEPAEGEDPT